MDENIFENKQVAENTMWAYRYLLELEELLQKLKSIQTNEQIEEMFKLARYTRTELKGIIFDLGCRLFATSMSEIEIIKPLPECKEKTLYCLQTATNVFR